MLSTIFWVLVKGLQLLVGSWVEIPEIIKVATVVLAYLAAEVAWHGPNSEAITGCIRKGVLIVIASIVSTLLGGEWNYEIFERVLVGIFICSDMEGLREFWEYRNSKNS